MSRYRHKKPAKRSSVIVGIGVFVLLALMAGIWSFIKKENKGYAYKQSVDIPQENQLTHGTDINQALEKKASTTGVNSVVGENLIIKKPVLVELDNSDDSFNEAIKKVSKGMGNWFEVKDTITKYVVLIHDMSQNQIVGKNRRFLKISTKNMVRKDVQGLYLADEGYKRYDDFANAVASIDEVKGLDLYLAYKPLFNKVYKTFSYPESYKVEDIFLKAAANVINAPVMEERVGIVKHSIFYKFSNPKLEALSDVEKQMLRMGPENTKKIQAKLRQLVEVISILNE